MILSFFFFNDTATTEIYTLSLHDALPISLACAGLANAQVNARSDNGDKNSPTPPGLYITPTALPKDRKSTRLNSSHSQISYAVFCLKKKKKIPRYSVP